MRAQARCLGEVREWADGARLKHTGKKPLCFSFSSSSSSNQQLFPSLIKRKNAAPLCLFFSSSCPARGFTSLARHIYLLGCCYALALPQQRRHLQRSLSVSKHINHAGQSAPPKFAKSIQWKKACPWPRAQPDWPSSIT